MGGDDDDDDDLTHKLTESVKTHTQKH